MSQDHTVLIGVSTGFRSSTFVERKLRDLIATGCKFRLFEEANGTAARALKRIGIDYESVLSTKRNSRSQLRKLLNDIDYLVIFWDGSSLSDLVFEARLLDKPTKVIPVEVTKVMNRDRGDDYDYYIGRGTPWGNPYPVGGGEGHYSRDESINLFRVHFKKTILTDESKRKGLLAMRGYKIACHCKPAACHGDVLADYINSIDPETQDLEPEFSEALTPRDEKHPA